MKRSGWKLNSRGRILASVLATTLVGGLGIGVASAEPTALPYIQNPAVTSTTSCTGVAGSGQAPDFAHDAYSVYSAVRDMGGDVYYRNGYFGQGVDVATIDTGVAPVKGFDGGNVISGPDLSFESQATNADRKNFDLPHSDTFGHGTHIAGIIAGRDDASGSTSWGHQPYSWDDATKFTGVAPGSRVVSVKVADSVGAVDVTQVIAAIDWVVQHRNDDGLHIRVLNLSYGIDSHDAAANNVLAHAVRQAWYAGIVVVAAGGNSGHGNRVLNNQGLLSPAYDPGIIAVGAYDNNGTLRYSSDDDTMAFSSADTRRHPDVLAPGAHVMSLHVPGSATDVMITDDCADAIVQDGAYRKPVFGTDGRFVRASGTSQSAAIVSGVVALMLSQDTSLTPNQVKGILTTTARKGGNDKKSVRGKGEVNLDGSGGAYYKNKNDVNPDPAIKPTNGSSQLDDARWQDALPCLSKDSVESNRGEYKRFGGARKWSGGMCSDVANLSSRDQAAYIESDVHGQSYNAAAHACDEEINPATQDYYPATTPCAGRDVAKTHVRVRPWVATTTGEMWNGSVWAGRGFGPSPDTKLGRRLWNTAAWQGKDWRGRLWRDHDWTGRFWTGRFWTGTAWEDSSWLGRFWTGRIWRDHSWADSSWS